MRKLLFTLLNLVVIFLPTIHAQGLFKVSMDRKVAAATLIVEGRVISQSSAWDPTHMAIYTTSQVEIYKIFKGTAATSVINVYTVGGAVGDDIQLASELLQLRVGQTGIFFGSPDTRPGYRNSNTYDIYASAQGFIQYDTDHQRASDPFDRYASITNELYFSLLSKTGRTYENRRPDFDVTRLKTPVLTARGNAPTITGFSPALVAAGKLAVPAENVLTISGSGFGTPSGSAKISFDAADDGSGGTPLDVVYNDPNVISWTDNQIQVRVPSGVGTGDFEVYDPTGQPTVAPAPLQVSYSILVGDWGASVPRYRMYALAAYNGTGYSYYYSTNTANGGVNFATSSVEAPFARAVKTWLEITGFNITYAGTTNLQVVAGGSTIPSITNVIMLDNTATGRPPLPDGVLAVCYSSGSTCASGTSITKLSGFDIVIRNAGVSIGSVDFNAGPCFTSTSVVQYDMESTVLHELGHAMTLGHVNDSYLGSLPNLDPGKVMNFAIVNGADRRSPDWSSYNGGLYAVNPKGLSYGTCLPVGEMVPYAGVIAEPNDECPFFPTDPTGSTTISFDLVHSTSNKYGDPAYTNVKLGGVGTAITNNAYYAIMTGPSGGTLNFAITGYATDPAAQAACAGAGVELSLYQVNSCPIGQTFPAPIAYRTFNANGSITGIAGLTPNTTYLLMADGINNTKALFDLSIAGSALPVHFLSFDGYKVGEQSQLKWSTGSETGNSVFEVETSKDGDHFYKIGSVDGAGTTSSVSNYQFLDVAPAQGINYYRLKQVDIDGHFTYSTVVTLRFDKGQLVSTYPNPASDRIIVLLAKPAGTLVTSLYAVDGKLLSSQRFTGVVRQQELDISKLAPGIYLLQTNVDGTLQQSRILKR